MPTDTTFGGIPDGGHRTAANPLPMKHILSYTRRALDDYGMIRSGERASASWARLTCTGARQFRDGGKATDASFIEQIEHEGFHHIVEMMPQRNMGFGGVPGDYSGIRDLCRRLAIPHRVVPSDIAEIVFGIRKEQNPCSLCAKMPGFGT